jgi:5-methylcytosine-specific restriction protein A
MYRPCRGCGGLFIGRGSRCPACLRKWRATYDRARPEHHALYSSAAWRKLSAEVRASSDRCYHCGKLTTKLVADHVIPVERRPDLALDPGNLVPSCVGCNTRRGRNLRPTYRQVGMFELIAQESRR